MTKRDDFIWKALIIATWLIFIGFCVQTGALLFNYVYSLFRPVATHNLHLGLNLSELYGKNIALYTCLFSLAVALSALKAYLFFQVTQLFRVLNFVKPFSERVSACITKISYYFLAIGLFGYTANQFTKALVHKGYEVDRIGRYWSGSETYLLMAAVLVVIAMIFRKGIELQNESDLTV